MIGRPVFIATHPDIHTVDCQTHEHSAPALAPPSYTMRRNRTEDSTMWIAIIILLFGGAMYMACRMLCGFVKMLSNSKK